MRECACVCMYIYVCMYITHFLKLVCHEEEFVSLLNYFLLDNCLFMFFFKEKFKFGWQFHQDIGQWSFCFFGLIC